MKTLSFLNLSVGRNKTKELLSVDSQRDGIEFRSGLNLIVAPNGFGKTSLLQTLAGAIKPLSGEIRMSDTGGGPKVGPRKFHPEQDALYVSEYLSFPKFIYPSEWIDFVAGRGGGNEDRNAQSLEYWMGEFRLKSEMNRFVGRLSQGERRKVTWLSAQASTKPVLLLDEPLDGLDLFGIRAARKMLNAWKNEGRIACIVAHQVGELLDLCDAIFVIGDKKLITWEKTASLAQFREKVSDFYDPRK